MSDKPKFPLKVARSLAEKIVEALADCCERIEIAGSIRRGKAEVGDVEIVYIPKLGEMPDVSDMFWKMIPCNLVDERLKEHIRNGALVKRHKITGDTTWGQLIKLARATKTGIPVDFFEANYENWHNYLVCRTGSKETNVRIASAALERGWEWKPYTRGFVSVPNVLQQRFWSDPMMSEEDVFKFVGLPFLQPSER